MSEAENKKIEALISKEYDRLAAKELTPAELVTHYAGAVLRYRDAVCGPSNTYCDANVSSHSPGGGGGTGSAYAAKEAAKRLAAAYGVELPPDEQIYNGKYINKYCGETRKLPISAHRNVMMEEQEKSEAVPELPKGIGVRITADMLYRIQDCKAQGMSVNKTSEVCGIKYKTAASHWDDVLPDRDDASAVRDGRLYYIDGEGKERWAPLEKTEKPKRKPKKDKTVVEAVETGGEEAMIAEAKTTAEKAEIRREDMPTAEEGRLEGDDEYYIRLPSGGKDDPAPLRLVSAEELKARYDETRVKMTVLLCAGLDAAEAAGLAPPATVSICGGEGREMFDCLVISHDGSVEISRQADKL